MVWERFMRFAQAGGLSDAEEEPDAASGPPPPTVPAVDDPPLASNAARAPDWKLDFRPSDARPVAFFRGETAALAPVEATLPRPEATAEAPVSPAAPRL